MQWPFVGLPTRLVVFCETRDLYAPLNDSIIKVGSQSVCDRLAGSQPTDNQAIIGVIIKFN